MHEKLGRNDKCWCGSGLKFKKCHLDRERQEKDNLWAAVDSNRKAFSSKMCWAKGVGLGDCEGPIIRAHTVSRGPNLNKISKNGHVKKFSGDVSSLIKSGGSLIIKDVGLRDASVFNGFCSKHDREIFSCIENEEFNGRSDQCLAIAYRTMSRELYGKDAGAHLRETLRTADKGRSSLQQVQLQFLLEEINIGNECARRELRNTHNQLTRGLVSKDFGVLKSVIFEFDSILPFSFAGAWSPFFDLHGSELQKGYADEIMEQIIVSSFISGSKTLICLSWRHIDNAPALLIANQLSALAKETTASALLQLVVKHVENIFFHPDWLHTIGEAEKLQLEKLAADGMDMLGRAPSIPLNFKLDFGLPMLLNTFEVN